MPLMIYFFHHGRQKGEKIMKKNKQPDKQLPEVSIITKIDGDITSVEETDKITLNLIKDCVTDNDKPREFLIFCEATNRKDVNSLHTALDQTLGFVVSKPSRHKNVWVIDGIKLISFNQLASTLKDVRSTVELHSCELVDWRVQVDNNSV